jgi:phage tail protein X
MTTSPTSALLPQEPVLLVQGRLAAVLGLAPALFLQQVHYWLLRSPHQYAGQPWIYNTYAQWQVQFPFLSRDQLARAVATLRRLGVLQVAHWDADRRERRNWYSIDYARLAAVLAATEEPVPAIADPTGRVPTADAIALPDTASVPTCGSTPASITAALPPLTTDDAEPMSARPCPIECPPMMPLCTMDDSAASAHPEITRSEITQRSSQEDAAPARAISPPPPCRSRIAERGSRNGLAGPGQHPGFARAAHPPSAPDGTEPLDANGPLYGTQIMSTAFLLPPAWAALVDRRAPAAADSLSHSAFRVPTSAFVWGAYRATLDPHAPPGLRTRIAADLAGAAARGVPLTARGLAYALEEAATARGPRWPYLFAIWQAHPNGAAEVGCRSAERGSRSSPAYPRSGMRPRFGVPPPLDPAKYAPGGKYGHLFARQTAVAT